MCFTRPSLILWGVCLTLAAFFAGCSSSSSKPEGTESPFYPRSSPRNLLLNLRAAYNERGLAQLESLFASDYVFNFTPQDLRYAWVPDSLTREQERLVHQHMFDAEDVPDIMLDFVIGDAQVHAERSSIDDTLWTATISLVNLRLYGITPDHDEPQMYRVTDGTAQFWFRRTSWTDPVSGDQVWTIVEWQDGPIQESRSGPPALPPSAESTWGQFKALFLGE